MLSTALHTSLLAIILNDPNHDDGSKEVLRLDLLQSMKYLAEVLT